MNRKGIIVACCIGSFAIGATSASASAYVQHLKTSDVVVKVKDISGLPLSASVKMATETKKGDVNGRMVFTGIAMGKQVLTATLDGYLSATQTIEVTERNTPLETIVLIKQPPTTRVVSLTTTDWLSGIPLSDVTVKFGDQTSRTDPSGNIRLDGIVAGDYQLNLSKSGYRTVMNPVTVKSRDVLMPTFKLIPEQRALAIRNGTLISIAIDGTQQQIITMPLGVPVSIHVSPDGTHGVVYSQTDTGLQYAWAVRTTGTSIRQLGTVKPGVSPVWSNDGSKVLIIASDSTITSFSADGTKLGQLTYPSYEATFSSDGNFIASASINPDETQRSSVLTISHSDGSSPKELARHPESLTSLIFTTPGNTLTYHSQNGTALQQFNVDVVTAKETQVPASALDLRPRAHAASTGLQARTNDNGNPEIMANDSSFIREVTTGGTSDPLQLPYFSTDGSILFFITTIHGSSVLNAAPVSGGAPISISINL